MSELYVVCKPCLLYSSIYDTTVAWTPKIKILYNSRFRGGVFLLGVLLGKQAQRKCGDDPYFIKN
jgi:hypothetical protein